MGERLKLRLWNPEEFGDPVPNLPPTDTEPPESVLSPTGYFGS